MSLPLLGAGPELGRLTYAATVLADSPVAYWRLEDPSGTTMTDSSGNGSNGTYVGSPTLGATGKVGSAVRFTAASSQYGKATGLAATADTFTLEFWMKLASTGSDYYLLTLGQDGGGVMIANDGRFRLVKTFGPVIVESTNLTTDTTGFHHFVAVKNGATSCKLYIDNTDVTGTVTDATCVSSTIASLAAWTTNGSAFGGYADATFDEVAIYNTALSAARVSAHYTAAG